MSARSKTDAKPNQVNRRSFLKRAGIGAGVAATAAVAGGALAVPLEKNTQLEAMYPPVPGNRAALPPNGKRVVILGGGLSGIQAAVELSSRGFQVTVLEKSGTPGGKLKTWRDKTFGPDDDPAKRDPNFRGYVREHGIHAIWGFYNNLREFMGRHGWHLMNPAENANLYHFLDKSGASAFIPQATWPAPYDRLQLILKQTNFMGISDEEQRRLQRAFLKLVTFDYADPKQRAYLDSMTLEAWGQKAGVPKLVIDKLFDSLLEMAYFDNADRASAVTLANLLQLTAGNAQDVKISLYANPAGETFVQPMLKHLEKHGGKVHFNTQVTSVEMEDGLVRRVTAAAVPGSPGVRVRRCAICGELIYGDEEHHECPFCGANGDMIMDLSEADKAERSYEADYFITAMDVPAAQAFVAPNRKSFGSHPYFDDILKLHATQVFVVDFWVEGTKAWKKSVRAEDGTPAFNFFATGFEQLGITINWSLPALIDGKERGIIDDYAGRDVSIIETQIANAGAVENLTNQQIADKCFAELRTVIPDLPAYRSFYVNRWRHYTAHHPGDEAHRPSIQSPIDNLLFIGDMVHIPHPAVFMEKTNVTAKMATNLLLQKAGQLQGQIEILPSGTPSSLINILRLVSSVYV